MTDAKSNAEEDAVELIRHASAVTDLKIRRAAWTQRHPCREAVIVRDGRRPDDFLLGHNYSVASGSTTRSAAAGGACAAGAACGIHAQPFRNRRYDSARR